MNKIEFPDVLPVFLDAINIPAFARSEYYLKNAEASGWSKWSYLRALNDAYHYYNTLYSLHSSKERRKYEKENRHWDESTFGISLETERRGRQKGLLTREKLEELLFAINYAYKWGRSPKQYSDLEILSFCERMLIFTWLKFKEQAEKTSSAFFVAERYRKEGRKIDQNPEYLLYSWTIITDAPILDFLKYKNAVRQLLLQSHNNEYLKLLLKPVYDYCIKVVDFWNNELSHIEEPFGEYESNRGKGIQERRLLQFDADDLKIWNRNTQSEEEFFREPATTYLNRDLAEFAVNVANLIAAEILNQPANVSRTLTVMDLDQLFVDPELANDCYNLLVEVALVDASFKYKKGYKSAFCLWINELQRGGYPIIDRVSDKEYTALLNKKFKGLNLKHFSFNKEMPRADAKYGEDFRQKIKELSKLSKSRRERK